MEIAVVFVFGRGSLVDSAASGVCHVRYQSRIDDGSGGWGWRRRWKSMHSVVVDVCGEMVFGLHAGDQLPLRASRFSDDSVAQTGDVEGDCPGVLSGRGEGQRLHDYAKGVLGAGVLCLHGCGSESEKYQDVARCGIVIVIVSIIFHSWYTMEGEMMMQSFLEKVEITF